MSLKDTALSLAKNISFLNKHHGVPIFEKDELVAAIANGQASALTYNQLLYIVSAKSIIPLAIRHSAIDNLALAIRSGHSHVYKLKISELQKNHLDVIKKAYDTMLDQLESYLRTGNFALAEKNSVLSLDPEERKKLENGIKIILLTLKIRIDAAARQPYSEAYRRGKEAGVEALKKAGADNIDTLSTSFTIKDAASLQAWYEFQDSASQGLIKDIEERIAEVLSKDALVSEDVLIADVLTAARIEAYRLPMYSWSSFSVAEEGQHVLFDAFNDSQRLAGKKEWTYKWLTAGDSNVCPICEALGEEKPRYLDKWAIMPGDVHIFCRCDLLPIQPEGF